MLTKFISKPSWHQYQYSSLLGIKLYTKTRGGRGDWILGFALLRFGIISSASLLSILLVRQLLWVVLFIWGLIPIIFTRHLLKILVLRIIEMVAKLIKDFRDCKFVATVVFIFKAKDFFIGSNKHHKSKSNYLLQSIP